MKSVMMTINAGLRFNSESQPDFGNTFTYGDSSDVVKACTVPKRRNQSIQYQFWESSPQNTWCALFWGDLLDFGDTEEVLSYFVRIMKGKTITQGFVEIAFVGYEPTLLRWSIDRKKWIRSGG